MFSSTWFDYYYTATSAQLSSSLVNYFAFSRLLNIFIRIKTDFDK